jgi:hypothetical protein
VENNHGNRESEILLKVVRQRSELPKPEISRDRPIQRDTWCRINDFAVSRSGKVKGQSRENSRSVNS